MPRPRDPAWLAEVRRPGPNGRTFFGVPHESFATALTSGGGLMEDDVDIAFFTPGCQAYAGYWDGTYANMTAVRGYAAIQHARSFSYTPSGARGADAYDIEPGDGVPSQAPHFYGIGGRYFYSMASETQLVINALAGAGVGRNSYKLISAHYIGEHMCGRTTCGYPDADATQFTDNYAGRSLDCTLFSPTFFRTPAPAPKPPVPVPVPVVSLEDDMFKLLPGKTQPWVTVSLAGTGFTTVGVASAVPTKIAVSFHNVDTGDWLPAEVKTAGGAGPKTVFLIPARTDAVNFERLDDVNIILVPNFS